MVSRKRKVLAIAAFLVTGAAGMLAPKKAQASCCDRPEWVNQGTCTLVGGMQACVSPGYSCDSTC